MILLIVVYLYTIEFGSITLSTKISINNVTKKYGDLTIISDLSLDVKDGEFFTLLGPSGCGKTTLLRMISGFNSVEAGEISFNDKCINDIPAHKRNIGMVFQNYALYPHMTVYENLAYGLKNRGVDRDTIASKIEKVAETLKIADYLDRKPAKLSGGQRQRVAMGRAIVREPQLFLFDEPLSNLDASLRAHMRLEIKKLQRELAVTSVYVTHDQVEAMTLADRIIVLNQGEIEQVGTPAEIYHQPTSTFVASFIGSPAMNFHQAEIADGVIIFEHQRLFFAEYAHLPAQKIQLGIRPEHAQLEPSNSGLSFSLTVQAVEPLGPNQLVHGLVNGRLFTALTPEFLSGDDHIL